MINLPQKKYGKTVLVFKDTILCELRMLINGLVKEKLTAEDKKHVTLKECSLGSWPPVQKSCEGCVLLNSPERFLEDKKGRRARVIK